MTGTRDHETERNIESAAHRFGVDAGLVHAILRDESRRLDVHDAMQNLLAASIVRLPAALGRVLVRAAQSVTRRPLTDQSFGCTQMKPATLLELAQAGYLVVPADLPGQLAMLRCPSQAPVLVAARIRQTTDHWAAHGVSIADRLDVLGTLYSLGLTGQQGVHPNPQATERGAAIAQTARHYRHARTRGAVGIFTGAH